MMVEESWSWWFPLIGPLIEPWITCSDFRVRWELIPIKQSIMPSRSMKPTCFAVGCQSVTTKPPTPISAAKRPHDDPIVIGR